MLVLVSASEYFVWPFLKLVLLSGNNYKFIGAIICTPQYIEWSNICWNCSPLKNCLLNERESAMKLTVQETQNNCQCFCCQGF